MHRLFSLLLRSALVAGCLTYAFWGIDFSKLVRALSSFDPLAFVLLAAFNFMSFLLQGLRLRFLSERAISVYDGSKASMLCLGLNNIFPAKLGEVAKALYIKKRGGLSGSNSLGLVFWERFFDLNLLLLLALFAMAGAGSRLVVLPAATAITLVWACLYVFRRRPQWAEKLARLIPFERLRLFATDFNHQLQARVKRGFFPFLLVLTALVWMQYILHVFLCLNWMAGFSLTPMQVLVVFVFAAMGMAVPSSPGGLGVYEAAMVFALTMFGIGKDIALAAALVIHMVQFIPTTVLGVLVMARSRLEIGAMRKNL